MKLFIDSADPKEIAKLADSGLVDGVTTNPSLAAKTGLDYVESLKEICATVAGPISAEVLATDTAGMISEGKRFAKIAKNIAIKVPLNWEGLKACRALADDGLMVNVTLCFSAVQAMMAAKAGATFISPFIGRLDDAGQDGEFDGVAWGHRGKMSARHGPLVPHSRGGGSKHRVWPRPLVVSRIVTLL